MKKDYIVLEGNTNDLLLVNGDSSLKSTRLVKLDLNATSEINEEIIDLAITSTSMKKEHKIAHIIWIIDTTKVILYSFWKHKIIRYDNRSRYNNWYFFIKEKPL